MSGGSSGIGRAVARLLADQGCQTAILSRRKPDAWPGGPLIGKTLPDWIQADLGDAASTVAALERWLEQGNAPDAVVFSAVHYGMGGRHPLTETSVEEWDQAFTVNVRAQFVMARTLLLRLPKERPLLFVSVGSDVVYGATLEGRIPYAASKAASHFIFEGLKQERTGRNLRVVEIYPCMAVDTPGIRGRRPQGFDFSGYMRAESFARPFGWLIATMGEDVDGKTLMMDERGACSTLEGTRVWPSESQHAG